MDREKRSVIALIIVLSVTSICLMGEARASISYFDTPVDFWGYYRAAKTQPAPPTKKKAQKPGEDAGQVGKNANIDTLQPPGMALPGNNPPEAAKNLLANPTRENAKKFIAWFENQIVQANKASQMVEQALAERAATSGQTGPLQYTRPSAPDTVPGQKLAANPAGPYAGYPAPATPFYAAGDVQKAEFYNNNPGNNRLIIYYFFSPRCPYCAKQSPTIEKLFREGGYKVLGIAMDTSESEVRQYINQAGLTFPIKMNTGESGIFNIKSYPAIILAATNGKAFRLQGLSTMEEIIDGLRQATGE